MSCRKYNHTVESQVYGGIPVPPNWIAPPQPDGNSSNKAEEYIDGGQIEVHLEALGEVILHTPEGGKVGSLEHPNGDDLEEVGRIVVLSVHRLSQLLALDEEYHIAGLNAIVTPRPTC